MKANAAGVDVFEAAGDEGAADVAAAATGGTVVEVLVSQAVVVVVVLDGAVVLDDDAVVVVVDVAGTVVEVVLVEVVVVEVEVLVELVLEVLVLVELGVVVEVDVDGLEVEVLVVVLAGHTVVVVVEDGTVVVVLVDVVLVVASTANPVGVVDPEPIVVAAARPPADRVAERTADPKRTFINRTDQRGIRQSFPPPASAPVRVAAPDSGFAIATHDGRWARWPEGYETVNVSRSSPDGCRPVGGPIVRIEAPRRASGPRGAVRSAGPGTIAPTCPLTRISSRCHAELTVF